MKKELFDELCESIREAGELRRKRINKEQKEVINSVINKLLSIINTYMSTNQEKIDAADLLLDYIKYIS